MKVDSMNLVSRRLAPFGAEIIGLDLERPLDEATAASIRGLWVDAGILLFRGAGSSADAHLRVSRVFGEPQPSATAKLNLKDNPYLMSLANKPGDTSSKTYTVFEVNGQQRTGWLGWHWDQSFMPEIVRGAVLRMIEPAAIDGRTGFIDAIAAYERLPATMKRRIERLEVVYHFEGRQEMNRFGFPKDLKVVQRSPDAEGAHAQFKLDFPPVVHPLVITQRETGRKILKLSPMHAQYVLGLEKDESDALLTQLAEILVDERHAYYHTWQANDLIVWDNWRVIHSATGVPPDCARHAQRTTIVGDYKLGRYLDPKSAEAKPTRRFDD
jgi:taurine dioxygenase